MKVTYNGFDVGAIPLACQHQFELIGDVLVHTVDGVERARIGKEGRDQFLADYPQAERCFNSGTQTPLPKIVPDYSHPVVNTGK